MSTFVTKTYLPPFDEYEGYLREIWGSGQITNQGALAQRLEDQLKTRYNLENLRLVTNGTIALQLALKALDIEDGEVITTPFSYVATTSAILWERCKPVFVDIEPDTFCIDPSKIEAAVTDKTRAIIAVHVFGFPCAVEEIEAIAQKHDLKVIYDAAHAFGASYEGKSLLSFGDISTCSFHATKLFHTVEGGCIVSKDAEVDKGIDLLRRFGHHGDDHIQLGINGKVSEVHAAMGLTNLNHIAEIIEARKQATEHYNELLGESVIIPRPRKGSFVPNYAYYPVLFKSQDELLRAVQRLESVDVYPRRYFYPSLNTLPYINEAADCPVSEDIASRILCLPLYAGLDKETIVSICNEINA